MKDPLLVDAVRSACAHMTCAEDSLRRAIDESGGMRTKSGTHMIDIRLALAGLIETLGCHREG